MISAAFGQILYRTLTSGTVLLMSRDATRNGNFFNFNNHDFVRVAVGVPSVRVADPVQRRCDRRADSRGAERKAVLVLFPELGLTAYSCDDLFQQRALLDACLDAIAAVVEATASCPSSRGRGAAPGRSSSIQLRDRDSSREDSRRRAEDRSPNYREFYEPRQFTSADAATRDEIDVLGQRGVPFGNNLIFQHEEQPLLTIHAEICEDLWVPISPSSYAALAGATVLLNLSASNITIGKADYRRALVASQSARCLAAYACSAAGAGESTTDLAWDGHALIAENGNIIAESERFKDQPQLVSAEIDLERLSQERMRQNTFGDTAHRELERVRRFRRFHFRPNCRDAARCRWSGVTSAFPMCHPIPRRATSDAPKSSTSRCRAWRRGCARPASSASSLECRAESIRLTPCWFARMRWTARRAAQEHSRFYDAGLRYQRAHPRAGAPANEIARLSTDEWTFVRAACRCSRTSGIRTPRVTRFTTSPLRMCRRASAPAICSGSRICAAGWWSAPAT